MRQQPALARQPAAITGEAAIAADDAVAGDDDADRVGAIGEADSTHRRGLADLPRERAIGEGHAAGNAAERRPDLALERGAAGSGRQTLDRRELAGEIGIE